VIHLQESLQGRDERQLRQFLAALYLQSAGPPGALSLPFGGAAIDPDFAVHLVQILNSRRPRLVVELGSGVSTVLCALVLREHGSGRIVSIEHDPVYAQATRERLATFHLEQVAEVRNAPLSEVDVDGRSWRWYDRSVFLDLENIDLLVVDGPPGWLHTQARFPALPVLIDRMSSNAAILLDDAGRQDEKSIIEDWLKRWPNLSRVDLPSEKGTALLVRTSERRHTDNPAAAD
jgi:predicted O-methyltransferase YrrM